MMARSQVLDVSTDPLHGIRAMFEIQRDQEDAVSLFLSEHEFLRPILIEAKDQIARVFGSDVPIFLELQSDPEEGWDELFVVIRSGLTAREALRLEKRLMDEWFLERMSDTHGKLNVVEEPL